MLCPNWATPQTPTGWTSSAQPWTGTASWFLMPFLVCTACQMCFTIDTADVTCLVRLVSEEGSILPAQIFEEIAVDW